MEYMVVIYLIIVLIQPIASLILLHQQIIQHQIK